MSEPTNDPSAGGSDRDSAEKCGCQNCGCVGMRMPDAPGKYAFDGVGSVTICVEGSGDCVVHFEGVENV